MKKFEILVDTTQDFTFDLASQYDLTLIPYYLNLDDKNLKDLVEIEKSDFYNNIDSYEKISTGVPPIQDILYKIEEIKKNGIHSALAITSSSDVTGMRNAYESVKSIVNDFNLKIVDSELVGSATGLIAIEASKFRAKGHSLEETRDYVDILKNKSKIFAIFRTLDYLVKGGRISPIKAAIGGFLNIFPILTIKDKKVEILEKARGQAKSLMRLAEIVKEDIGDSKEYHIVLFQGSNQEEFLKLKELLKDQIEKSGLYMETVLTPVLGVHAGPSAIGVSILKLD